MVVNKFKDFDPLKNSSSSALCYYREDLPIVLCSGAMVNNDPLIIIKFLSETEATDDMLVAVRGFKSAFWFSSVFSFL